MDDTEMLRSRYRIKIRELDEDIKNYKLKLKSTHKIIADHEAKLQVAVDCLTSLGDFVDDGCCEIIDEALEKIKAK